MMNPASWAVLVIDLQNKYTARGSPYRVPDADALVQRVGSFVESARDLGASVAWIARRPHPQLGVGRRTERLFGASLGEFHNEEMNAIDARLRSGRDDITIDKPRHSAFYATDLQQHLEERDITGVVITGVTTNVCCLATALDAVARDLDVVVASDLTSALPIRRGGVESMPAGEVQETTLQLMAYAVGDIESSTQVLAAWGASGS